MKLSVLPLGLVFLISCEFIFTATAQNSSVCTEKFQVFNKDGGFVKSICFVNLLRTQTKAKDFCVANKMVLYNPSNMTSNTALANFAKVRFRGVASKKGFIAKDGANCRAINGVGFFNTVTCTVTYPFFCEFQEIAPQIVQITDGKILGTTLKSRLGRAFYAFRKIPFAQPPVGALRYAAPLPNLPWTGVLNGTVAGPMCAQKALIPFADVSEDCLQLNVYTPSLPNATNTKLLPVIVHVHGGAFEMGSGATSDPSFLLDRDIVLVLVNYRLSSFGFMATGTSEIPGNAGLKDQSLALKWVQKNIRSFGGDPTKVTLSGQSAGAHSVTAHLISPMSRGLFHRVIALSGGIAWQRKLQRDNLDTVKKQAALVNCTTSTVDAMLTCLKATSWRSIVNTNAYLTEFSECPILSWLPVVEPDLGQERFIEDEPVKLFREGNFQRVPVITGVTEDEFSSSADRVLSSPTLLQKLNSNFSYVAPLCFNYETGTAKSLEISTKFRESYFPFDVIDRRSFNNLINIFADGTIGYGVHRFAHLIANYTDVFYYKFTYTGRYSFFYNSAKQPYGVHHTDDLQYLLWLQFISPSFTEQDPEHVTVERFTRIWQTFAATGNPNNSNDTFLATLVWNKLNVSLENYLDFGNNMVEKNGLYLERFSLWDRFDTA